MKITILVNLIFREAYDDVNFGQKEFFEGCKDIAQQLIEENAYINVSNFDSNKKISCLMLLNKNTTIFLQLILAGGRNKFLSKNDFDYSEMNKTGTRTDNRNLINEWIQKMKLNNKKHKFLWNLTDFNQLRPNQYDHILGLIS